MACLDYNSKSGRFTWKVHRGCVTKGTPAQSPTGNGYVEIGFEGSSYLAHRVAWLFTYGDWPRQSIDHIDGDRANNAIRNLRDVSHSTNLANRKNALGVTFAHGKWNVEITVAYKKIYLGRYKKFTEARAAYLAARREFHGS